MVGFRPYPHPFGPPMVPYHTLEKVGSPRAFFLSLFPSTVVQDLKPLVLVPVRASLPRARGPVPTVLRCEK